MIERIHIQGCGKPIRPGLRKNKANCQCPEIVNGATPANIHSSTAERNPANPSQLGGLSTELASRVSAPQQQSLNGSAPLKHHMKDITSATSANDQ